ncbi:MAG: hypothetical protein ACK5QX_11420 [bacterium]
MLRGIGGQAFNLSRGEPPGALHATGAARRFQGGHVAPLAARGMGQHGADRRDHFPELCCGLRIWPAAALDDAINQRLVDV